MDGQAFDDVARTAASLPRRQSLLMLGGAGLAAALGGASVAKAAKDAKKKCKKQKKQCRNAVQNFCADLEETEEDEQECLDAVLPCCRSCKVKAGVICVLDIFTNPSMARLAR